MIDQTEDGMACQAVVEGMATGHHHVNNNCNDHEEALKPQNLSISAGVNSMAVAALEKQQDLLKSDQNQVDMEVISQSAVAF